MLGRCRRSVSLFDTGKQRNRFSNAYEEIKKYGVVFNGREIVYVEKMRANIFHVKDEKGLEYHSKKMLIATGIRDNIPSITGIEAFYGKSIFHCPYCDGWEVRDKNVGAYAKNKNGFELAISLLTRSKTVTLYSDGRNYLKPLEREALQRKKIEVIVEKIARLEGKNGQLLHIVFSNKKKKQKCDTFFL